MCPHGIPIRVGDAEMCLECMESGLDHLLDLQWRSAALAKIPSVMLDQKGSKEPKNPEPPDDSKTSKRVNEPAIWTMEVKDGRPLVTAAMTRSDARAIFKQTLGLRPEQRLPMGSVIHQIKAKAKKGKT